MTAHNTLDRLARPMPTTGRLGVATLWCLWLAAPAAVAYEYTQVAAMWILFCLLWFGLITWIAMKTNTHADRPLPSPVISTIARVAPIIMLLVIASGVTISLLAEAPIAAVVAALLTLGFAIGITPAVAASATVGHANEGNQGNQPAE